MQSCHGGTLREVIRSVYCEMSQPERLKVRIRAASTAEGGRVHPMSSGYRPSFWWGDVSEQGREYHDAEITFETVETLAPGEEATAILRPFYPEYWYDLSVRSVLSLYEGARLVGTATVE